MKKIFITILILCSLSASSQNTFTVYSNVLHGDTNFLVRTVNSFSLDSQIRYTYTYTEECNPECVTIVDSTPYVYRYRTFTGSVKDSVQIVTPVAFNSYPTLSRLIDSLQAVRQAAINALQNKLNTDGNGSQLTGLTKGQVSLGNVDNTSDANKPLSTATVNALALKETIPVSGQGIGGVVTQNANKTTAVTLNKLSGQITMNGAALAAAAEVAFTLNNSTIAATDVVIVNVQSVGTAGAYLVSVGAVANGSCSITVSNASAASLSQAIVLNFAVIKAVNN